MMQKVMESEGHGQIKQASPPPSPLPPPLPKSFAATKPAVKRCMTSVTNQEIASFWRQKRWVEEDHLLAAIKAAARIRARNLSEEDYKHFEESLKDTETNMKESKATNDNLSKEDETRELRVGIKDWWTKSKYAYLNQPAIDSTDYPRKRTSTYIPNLCFYNPTAPQPTSLGIF